MNNTKFNIVLERIAAGDSLFMACHVASVTPAALMGWIMKQPDSLARYAALNFTRAERLQRKAERLQAKLSDRIDRGLIRTRGMAEVETAQIGRLFNEAENLRYVTERKLFT